MMFVCVCVCVFLHIDQKAYISAHGTCTHWHITHTPIHTHKQKPQTNQRTHHWRGWGWRWGRSETQHTHIYAKKVDFNIARKTQCLRTFEKEADIHTHCHTHKYSKVHNHKHTHTVAGKSVRDLQHIDIIMKKLIQENQHTCTQNKSNTKRQQTDLEILVGVGVEVI